MPVVERLIEVWEPFVKCLFTPRVCVFGVAICQLDWCDHKLSRRMVVGHLVIFQMHMLQFPVCVCVCVYVCDCGCKCVESVCVSAACVCVSIRVCVYVCVCLSVCVCVGVCVCIYVSI